MLKLWGENMRKLKNKEIDLIKFGLIIITLIVCVVWLYSLTLPKPEPMDIQSGIIFISICFGISLIVHGFHPILLCKR